MRRGDRRPARPREQARDALGDGLGVTGERATGRACRWHWPTNWRKKTPSANLTSLASLLSALAVSLTGLTRPSSSIARTRPGNMFSYVWPIIVP